MPWRCSLSLPIKHPLMSKMPFGFDFSTRIPPFIMGQKNWPGEPAFRFTFIKLSARNGASIPSVSTNSPTMPAVCRKANLQSGTLHFWSGKSARPRNTGYGLTGGGNAASRQMPLCFAKKSITDRSKAMLSSRAALLKCTLALTTYPAQYTFYYSAIPQGLPNSLNIFFL